MDATYKIMFACVILHMMIIENKRNNNLEPLFDLNFFENNLSEDWRFRPIWKALQSLKFFNTLQFTKWLGRTFVATLFDFASNVHYAWIYYKYALVYNKTNFILFWFIDLLGLFCLNLL